MPDSGLDSLFDLPGVGCIVKWSAKPELEKLADSLEVRKISESGSNPGEAAPESDPIMDEDNSSYCGREACNAKKHLTLHF